MQLFNPLPSPMVPNNTLSRCDGDPVEDPHLYRSIVGALQYATLTRTDIAFAVLHYLKGTISHGLTLRSASPLALHAFCDADWASSIDDCKSTSGFCIFLRDNLGSWGSKKQPIVARSSTETEYKSLAVTSSELIWLQYILIELHVSLSSPSVLWCDNIRATFLASNPMFHARTKHIEIDYYFVRERVANKSLQICFLTSKDQLADIFTKPLASPRFILLSGG